MRIGSQINELLPGVCASSQFGGFLIKTLPANPQVKIKISAIRGHAAGVVKGNARGHHQKMLYRRFPVRRTVVLRRILFNFVVQIFNHAILERHAHHSRGKALGRGHHHVGRIFSHALIIFFGNNLAVIQHHQAD